MFLLRKSRTARRLRSAYVGPEVRVENVRRKRGHASPLT